MDVRKVNARSVSAQRDGHALGFSEVVRVGENNEVERRLRRGIFDSVLEQASKDAWTTLFERPGAAMFMRRLCRSKEENPLMLGDRSLRRMRGAWAFWVMV